MFITVNEDDDDGVDNINHDVALHPIFEISIFWCPFSFELQMIILTPYRVESIDKTLIFGLDTTINR